MLARREAVHLILLVLVGNARGDDDGCFLIVHTVKMPYSVAIVHRVQVRQDTWNFYRNHQGFGINGLTSKGKLETSKSLAHEHMLPFPTRLRENILRRRPERQMVKIQAVRG